MANNKRDDFSVKTKEFLAKRVNFICSNQDCCRGTLAPKTDDDSFINTGVAAHICAAAPGGPRYDSKMTSEQRKSVDNGIWLCQTCSKLIDSDVKKYSVEVLKNWKSKAEARAEEGIVKPIYESTNIDNKFIEIISNDTPSLDLVTGDSEEKGYSELYKDYIKKFEFIKDYIYCETFGNIFDKKFDNLNNDEYIILGKDILDWLMGKREFPINQLISFYDKLSIDYKFENDSLIKRRWDGIISYFKGNIEESYKIYIELLDKVKLTKNIPSWFKDDIYIDGRNIYNLLDNIAGRFSINNIFQNQLDKNNHKLSYPVIDRIRSDIYENTIEKVIEYKNKSRNTIIYGIGLERLLNYIQEAVYISIMYGSITQLRLVRKILSNSLGIYSDCYKEEKFYKLTLKLKVLSGEFKEFKKIYNTIKYEYKFVNSKEFISEIFELQNSMLTFDIDNYYCFIFDVYGRNIADDKFKYLESKIYEILDEKKDVNPYFIETTLRSITNNIHRINNKKKLFHLLLLYIKKDYSRFYMYFSDILNNIIINELNESEKIAYIRLVKKCYKLDNVNVVHAIMNIKKYTGINFFDEYLTKSRYTRIINNLNNNENHKALKDILDDIDKIVKQRDEKPGVHVGYAVHYNLSNFFIKKDYTEEMKKLIINDFFPLAKRILISKNQYAYEKINILNAVIDIVICDESEEIKKECELLIKNIALESAKNPFGKIKSEIDIKINELLFEYACNKITLSSLLSKYLIYAVEDDSNLEEILKCIIQLIKWKKISNANIEKIYIIYNLAINKRKNEITKYVIELSSVFINTQFYEYIEIDLNEIISYNNYDELIFIVDMIHNLTNKKRYKMQKIISILEKNENYNLKYVINKYLKNGGK